MEDLRYVSKYTGERIDELLGKVEGMAAEAEAIAKEAAKEEALPYAQRAESASLQVQNMSVSAVQIESNQTADVAKEVMEDGSVRLKFSIPKGTYIQDIQKTAGTGSPGTKDTYTVSISDGATFDFEVYNGEDGNGSGDFKKDGTVAMQADINMDGFGLKNLRKPTMETDCVRVVDMKEMATQNIVGYEEGTNISVADSRNAEPVGLNLFGKSEQFSTTGKNLAKVRKDPKDDSGVTFTFNQEKGEVNVSGTCTAMFGMTIADIPSKLKPGTYMLSGCPKNLSGFTYRFQIEIKYTDGTKNYIQDNGSGVKFTITKEVEAAIIVFVMGEGSTDGFVIKPMLNVGEQVEEFEPYTGGIPSPNPNYPQEVKSVGDSGNIGVTVCGKNLIPKGYTSKTTNGLTFTVNDDGSVTVNGTAESNTGFNIIREYEIPGDVIISGCPAGGSVKTYSIYAQNYDFTGNALSDTGEGKLIKKSDFDKPIILRIWILAGQTVSNLVFKPMIRSASIEDDTFEPYTAQQLTIATPNGLPGLEVTDPALATYTDDKGRMWCADEVDFERGIYIQRIGRLALKDVPDWSRYVYANGTVSYYNHNVLTDTIDTHTKINGLCTHVYNKSVTEISNNFIIHSDKNKGIELKNITDTWGLTDDTSTIKSQIYALGVELIYILAKPIETTLTAEELAAYAAIHTNRPNTTVMNDSGAYMAMKYLRDIDDETTSYLLIKIKELKTLIDSMKE